MTQRDPGSPLSREVDALQFEKLSQPGYLVAGQFEIDLPNDTHSFELKVAVFATSLFCRLPGGLLGPWIASLVPGPIHIFFGILIDSPCD